MANEMLPNYLSAAKANPMDKRAPWYKNTAPSYAGIFLSVPFMAGMAGALQYGSVWAGFVGLLIGALFCFALYYAPAMLGLRTGLPLYVVGSSTFGTQGGIIMPGILMGILQIGWHAVFTFSAASFFMQAIGKDGSGGTAFFWIVCAIWGLAFAFVGAVGISGLDGYPVDSHFPLVVIISPGSSNMSVIQFKGAENCRFAGFIPVLDLAICGIAGNRRFSQNPRGGRCGFCHQQPGFKKSCAGRFCGHHHRRLVAGTFAL